jgi:DNA-binding NtrC family response regulator
VSQSWPSGAPSNPSTALDQLLLCRSRAMVDLRDQASRVAFGNARVLITGESGVGKDVIARFIHAKSARVAAPFVVAHCAGLPDAHLEKLLFGQSSLRAETPTDSVGGGGMSNGSMAPVIHEAGSSALEAAHQGSLYLDEIAELPLRVQARLLRFLESGEVGPPSVFGGAEALDVRLITSTNRDLSEMVAHGQFREDLVYRIRVVHLHVSPLRDRREDIRPLIEAKLQASGRHFVLTDPAWRALEQYEWPGNVRELSNVAEQIAWLSARDTIGVDDLPEPLPSHAAGRVSPMKERRRQVADDLYTGLVEGRYQFWNDIYPLFLSRDMTREDLRGLIRRGLITTRGSYRALLVLFGMPKADYKRLLNFLAAHECALDFREFRPTRASSVAPRGDSSKNG